jgi:hypothetical protein
MLLHGDGEFMHAKEHRSICPARLARGALGRQKEASELDSRGGGADDAIASRAAFFALLAS